MVSISTTISANSFAICILKKVFNSVAGSIRAEIILHHDCSATVYLDKYEAKDLAVKFERMIPELTQGYAKHFRDIRSNLLSQIRIVERGEAPIEKPIKKPETPPAWMLEIDPEL
jgi:hypothetical protein